jgi:transformation/transcription domain-associated protein
MLTFDAPLYGNLCRTFETRTAGLPSWVWLPWIPQLLSSLCRVEARAMKAILVGILKEHPQALYYSLRSFYLERRDIERSTGQKMSPSTDEDVLTSSRLAEEFMSNLRKAHPVLWSKLESILEDLIVRFRPSYEAELLNSMVALLQKIKSAAQMEACTKTLHMLGAKFFNFNKERPESSATRALFHTKYAELFKNDFLEDTSGLDGDVIVAKLEKWKAFLEQGISRVPKTSNLQEVSPSLSWFSAQPPDLWAGACESKSLTASNAQHDAYSTLDNALFRAKRSSALAATKASSQAVLFAANAEGLSGHSGGGAAAVEIPGQYAPTSANTVDSRPFPELHAKLARFHQSIKLTSSSSKHYVYQITMIGSDGKAYTFQLQLAIPYWIRTDERSAQVHYVVGKTLRRDFRACRRCLSTRPSVVIPIAQRMRMSAIKSSHDSLDAVFCHVQGPKTSSLASYFEETVAERAASRHVDVEESATMNNIKLEVFRDICEALVLPNVLSKYMSEMIASTEHLYRFRQEFASQLAVNSLLQYAFAVVERTPNRFGFCNVTGQILSQDFRSQYNHGTHA